MLTLNGCSSIQDPVEIKDEPLYYIKGVPTAKAGDNYAVEMHFLTEGQTQLTKSDWDGISQGMVAMPLATFEDFNTEIGKLCSQVTCDYETQQKLVALMTRLRAAAEQQRE